jgi:threonine synthase
MGYELAEQLPELPDVIIYPTGGGTGLIGMWKAFDEMQEMGGSVQNGRGWCLFNLRPVPL